MALPLLLSAAGLTEATPGVATALVVSAAITKLMALPAVDKLLPKWLRLGDTV